MNDELQPGTMHALVIAVEELDACDDPELCEKQESQIVDRLAEITYPEYDSSSEEPDIPNWTPDGYYVHEDTLTVLAMLCISTAKRILALNGKHKDEHCDNLLGLALGFLTFTLEGPTGEDDVTDN